MPQKAFSKIFILVILVIIGALGFLAYLSKGPQEERPPLSDILFPPLALASSFPAYTFEETIYNNPEYSLPLSELPENYQRDIVERFGKQLTEEQKEILLTNGVLIMAGQDYDRFENAYGELSDEDIPIFITADSILHLFHIEFNEILKNLEIKKLSPILKEFLEAVIKEAEEQTGAEKELAQRNIAYLAVAMKLLNPSYKVPSSVKKEVEQEIQRIEDHKGFYKSPIFSSGCPEECLDKVLPQGLAFTSGQYPDGEKCSQEVKGANIPYEGKIWDSLEFYKEVCTRKCYCEDYSQYVPRGHYTSSEELKRYFKAMMWLGRLTFKARGDDWTKQALLLTLAVKSAAVENLWKKIYSITGFFAGASDDLTFYDYSQALNELITTPLSAENIADINIDEFREAIVKLRGPKILGGFEIDLAGNLKDLTQGMRLIGQRYAIDSQILGDLVYKNVGPNPDSPYYNEVMKAMGLSKPLTCQDMEKDGLGRGWGKEEYWNAVCEVALNLYETQPEKLYSVCRFMPTGLDVMNTLGSKKAEQVLDEYYDNSYCDCDKKQEELKQLVKSYDETEWTKNLYNTWLWMLQPILKEKPNGLPNWMRSGLWKLKDLITGLSSWAELRHDTILYVKQSYTWAVAKETAMPPIEAKYYGYVEANPELFARAKYAVEYLEAGLKEQGVMTDEVALALQQSSEMMARLEKISEKELQGEALTENDYNYIKDIDEQFNNILQKLASALTIKEKKPLMKPGLIEETSLEGKDEAFKTSMIADVHTETNTKKVLEVGTGKVDWLLVAHKSKEGRIGIAIGPMFSYFEFAWPMKDRLTDEKWRAEVMDSMKRPIWYDEAGINSSNKPYIVVEE